VAKRPLRLHTLRHAAAPRPASDYPRGGRRCRERRLDPHSIAV